MNASQVIINTITNDTYLHTVIPYFVDPPGHSNYLGNGPICDLSLKSILHGKHVQLVTGGFTVTLKFIAYQLLTNQIWLVPQDTLPIYLPIHQLNYVNTTLWNMVEQFYGVDTTELHNKRIVWLLDGTDKLDEASLSHIDLASPLNHTYIVSSSHYLLGSFLKFKFPQIKDNWTVIQFNVQNTYSFCQCIYSKLTHNTINDQVLKQFIERYFIMNNEHSYVDGIVSIVMAYIFLQNTGRLHLLQPIMYQQAVSVTSIYQWKLCFHITSIYPDKHNAIKYLLFLLSFNYGKFTYSSQTSLKSISRGYKLDNYTHNNDMFIDKINKSTIKFKADCDIIQLLSTLDVNESEFISKSNWYFQILQDRYIITESLTLYANILATANFMGVIGIQSLIKLLDTVH